MENTREKRRIPLQEENAASEKRARFQEGQEEKIPQKELELAVISFDVVFNESLSVFRTCNKKQPGEFVVTLYCLPDPQANSEADGENKNGQLLSKFTPFQARVLNESLSVSTARHQSIFNFHSQFARTSDFFVDVDLGFAVRIRRVELKDALNIGRVSTVSGGLNCLGNHDHWSYGHWQPSWSRSIGPHSIEDLSTPGKTLTSVIMVPEIAQATPVSTFRFEINFYAKGTFFTDVIPYVRMNAEISKALTSDSQLCNSISVKCQTESDTKTAMPSWEPLPERALIKIAGYLRGSSRLKGLLSLSATCHRFREILRHEPSLYTVIDFKFVAVSSFSNALFNFVAERATDVKHLRIAWLPHLPDGVSFKKFLRGLAPTMRSFVAEACPFVDDKVLRILSETQPDLENLDLTRCRAISPDAFRYIVLFKKLRRLSVQHTNIAERPLCQLIESFSSLEVLNYASCVNFAEGRFAKSPDTLVSPVFQSLLKADTTPNLLGLKINQMQCDTESFISLIKRCPKLEELSCIEPDFFECRLDSSIFAEIVRSCPQMKRLSISELHYRQSLKDEDLEKLIEGLPNLEYVFALPANVTAEFIDAAFEKSSKLICLVLAGRKISPDEVERLKEKFPHRRFAYTDFRPLPAPLNDSSEVASSSENSLEDESSADDDGSTGFGDTLVSSEETRDELERFQEETDAHMTTLVTSVKDMTNTVENVHVVLENLLSKRMFFKRKAIQADIRFAMATATYHERYDVLAMLLERCPNKDLAEVLDGNVPLLNFAIRRRSMNAIRMLLEKGASPNPKTTMSAMGQAIVKLMDIFDDEEYTPAVGASFCELFNLLFSYKADPLFFSPEEKGTNVLHYSGYLAGHSPEIADLLIAKTPGSAYFSQEVFNTDAYEGPTPLASVFDMVDISDELADAKNTFSHALLPLLRYGAPYKPDVCFSTRAFIEIVALDHHFSPLIWDKANVLGQILVESRRHSNLDVAALIKMTTPRRPRPAEVDAEAAANENNGDENESVASGESENSGFDGVSDDETGDLVLPYASFIRSLFPRPLQAQCRTVILNNLPVGPSRPKAVTNLDLPKSLTDFLNFEEFSFQ